MWQISFIIVPIAVALILPNVLYSTAIEKGNLKKGNFICKCPTAYRIISLLGILLFSFLFLMAYFTDEEKRINLVYIISFVFILIFLIAGYFCFRYKIILNINNNEVIVYRLFGIKKRFAFETIFSLETKNEIVVVKNLENKKLFYVLILLTGYSKLAACLRIIANNNMRKESISSDKIKEILQRKLW